MTSGCSFDSYYTTVAYTTSCPSLQDICRTGNDTNHCNAGFNEQVQQCVSGTIFCQGGNPQLVGYNAQCTPTNPQMPAPAVNPDNVTVQCCLNQINTPRGTCGLGYCLNGSECGTTMASFCANVGYIDECKSFAAQTTNPNNRSEVVSALLEKHYPSGSSPIGNSFNSTAVEICTTYPELCENKLQTICTQVTDPNELQNDESLLKLCGCYLPTKLYELPGIVPRECQTFCNYPGTVPLVENNQVVQCKSTNCILDLNIVNSVINGKFKVDQTCKSAVQDNGFNCYLSNEAYAEAMQNKIQLQQECGACFTFDPKDPTFTTKSVDCVGKGPPPPPPPIPGWSWTTIIMIIIGVLLVLLIFALIVGFIVHRNKKKQFEQYYREYGAYYGR